MSYTYYILNEQETIVDFIYNIEFVFCTEINVNNQNIITSFKLKNLYIIVKLKKTHILSLGNDSVIQ